MNSITIGRNPQNTIVVGAEHTTVSGNHATIEQVDNQLYITDHSTNGTLVNGSQVHNRRMAVSSYDTILLGNHYPLNMQAVMRYFSNGTQVITRQATQAYPSSHRPQGMVVNINNNAQAQNVVQQPQSSEQRNNPVAERETPNNLNSFNWGAFWLGWIWGCGNGIYWPLVTLIPYIGWGAGLVISFVLGFNGNKMAWEKYQGSADEFEAKQAAWTKGAWIYIICLFSISFIIGILIGLAG